MRISVMCHGEVSGGAGIFRGRRDDALTPRGFEQMAEVAACLSQPPLARIASSPQRRCLAFAEQFAAGAGLGIDVLAALSELDYGEWEGLTAQEAAQRYPEGYRVYRGSAGKVAPPGGESILGMRRRVRAIWESWLASAPSGQLLLITHPGVMRALLAELIDVRDAYSWRIALPEVAHFIIELRPGEAPELQALNNCFSLQSGARPRQ